MHLRHISNKKHRTHCHATQQLNALPLSYTQAPCTSFHESYYGLKFRQLILEHPTAFMVKKKSLIMLKVTFLSITIVKHTEVKSENYFSQTPNKGLSLI